MTSTPPESTEQIPPNALSTMLDPTNPLSTHFIMPLFRKQTQFMSLTQKAITSQRDRCLERVDGLAEQILNQKFPQVEKELDDIVERLDELEKHQQILTEHMQHHVEQAKQREESQQEMQNMEVRMQEMLTKSLGDLREELTRHLREEMREAMLQEVDTMRKTNEALTQRIDAFTTQNKANEDAVGEMREKIQKLEQQVMDLSSQVETTQNETKDLIEKRLAELQEECVQRFIALEEQQTNSKEGNTELQAALQSLDEFKQQTSQQLDKLQALEASLTESKTLTESLRSDLDKTRTSTTELSQSISTINKRDEAHQADITFLKKKTQSLTDNIASNAQNLTVLDSKLRELTDAYNESTEKNHENFSVVQANIEDVAIAHDNVRESIASLTEMTTLLDERVSALEMDHQSNPRSASAPPKATPNSQLKWNEVLTASDCTVTEDGATISRTKVTDTDHVTSLGNKLFQRGEHTWKVQLKNVAKTRDIYVGVVDPSKIKVNQQSIHQSTHGWCLSLSDFKCYHNGEAVSEANGIDSVRNGDIVTFALSLTEKTMQIKMNGKEVAVMSNIIAPVSPAISLGAEKSLSASLLSIS